MHTGSKSVVTFTSCHLCVAIKVCNNEQLLSCCPVVDLELTCSLCAHVLLGLRSGCGLEPIQSTLQQFGIAPHSELLTLAIYKLELHEAHVPRANINIR